MINQEVPAPLVRLSQSDVSRVLDRLPVTRSMVYILVTATLGFLFDSFDTNMVAYAMPSIKAEWQLSPVTLGLIASSALWGTVLGQYFWGPIADLRGRRFAFLWTIASFALLTGLAGLAWSPAAFVVARFIAGAGLGGFIPLDAVMISEFAPTRVRGRMVSLLPVFFPAGQVLAAFIALMVLPVFGWRSLFFIGAAPALLALWARSKVPESPRWLAIKGRGDEARKALRFLGASEEEINGAADRSAAEIPGGPQGARFPELFSPQYLSRTVLSWGIWVCENFGYFGFLMWLPSILVTIFKFSLVKSLTYTLVVAAAGTVGRIVAVYLIDLVGRRKLLIVGFALYGVAALLFGLAKTPPLLLSMAALFAFFGDMLGATIVTYVPELYPTRLRAIGASWAAAPGRIAAALAPMILGGLMAANSYYTVWVVFAGMFWLGAVLALFLGVETKGRALEEVAE